MQQPCMRGQRQLVSGEFARDEVERYLKRFRRMVCDVLIEEGTKMSDETQGESVAYTPGNRGTAIIMEWQLVFDRGDPLNGSLYICRRPAEESDAALAVAVDRLREAGLWSDEMPREVLDSQKAVYCEQLSFLEAATASVDGAVLLLARYDHPRFPSDADRYRAWCRCLGAN